MNLDEINYIDILDCNGGEDYGRSVCDKFQSGNQYSRSIRKRFLLGRWKMGRDRADGD